MNDAGARYGELWCRDSCPRRNDGVGAEMAENVNARDAEDAKGADDEGTA